MNRYLNPNRGQAILKPVEESEQTYGNIIIPDLANTKASHAIIVAMNPIYNFNLGEVVENIFEIGDTVLFPSMGAQKVKLDGEDFFICGIQDLLASIKTKE